MTSPQELKRVYVRYVDHVLYHRATAPEALRPEIRETVGWLVSDSADFVIVSWDRSIEQPTLKGNGDPKASGLVIMKNAILEMKPFA